MSDKNRRANKLVLTTTIGVIAGLAGCTGNDVEYHYDIPKDTSSCPGNMTYRDGGPGIVDRDGGPVIVDRDGVDVTAYCEETTCPGGNWSTQPAEIVWHQNLNKSVVARRTCLSNPPNPSPPCPASCSNPTPTP